VTARLSPEARELIRRRASSSQAAASEIERISSDVSSPLSFGQEMVWLSTQLDKSTIAYNRCSALHIDGSVDVNALERALSAIVERHEVLRTRIVLDNEVPAIRVLAPEQVRLDVVDVSLVPVSHRDAHTRELLAAEACKSFDLDTGPWLRAGLITKSPGESTLFISTHHIASDGWSDAIMFSELHAFYAAFQNGTSLSLAPLAAQYRELAAVQRRRAASPEGQRDREYWRTNLSGAGENQNWPTDRAKQDDESVTAGIVTRLVSADVVQSLEKIARQIGATPAMTSLAAFMLLKSRFTGQQDTIVGMSVAGRTRREAEHLIGLFSGVVPIRVSVQPHTTFTDLIRDVRIAVLEAHEHQQVAVDSLMPPQSSAGRARRAGISPTLFNFRNMPAFPATLAGVKVRPVAVFNETCVAPLDLEVIEVDEGWKCDLKFRTGWYDEEAAARFLGHYATLLEAIAKNPDVPIGRQSILSAAQRRQLTVEFSGPVRPLPEGLRLEGMFRAQARKTPRAIAVQSTVASIDYRTLDERSDALAVQLISKGVSDADRVAVCMNRSVELIVSLLAILKSGAAFVPLDPELPPRRLAYMIADTDPVLIITDSNGAELVGSTDPRIVLVDADYLAALPAKTPPPVNDDSQAVACVLYTSGSTGLPKGVLSPNRGIANNLLSMQEMYPISESDCMLQHTSLGFDAAAWEIFWPLSLGARIYLARPGGQRDAEYLVNTMRDQRCSMIVASPSLMKVMLEVRGFGEWPGLRWALAIGEVLSPALREKFYERMPHTTLHNLYGPSEASIVATEWTCRRNTARRSVPIGRALPNVELLILDPEMQPVPIGVAGEIYVGGIGVAPGYLNRSELTAERFLPHPLKPETGERVYRTGDIARFDSDGIVEYIGRRDHQLKIRGVRVELEEVQAALERLPAIRESVVVSRRDAHGEHQLIAFVATDNAGPMSTIRRALEEELPPQFLPSVIVPLKELPHGPNGKVDRAALPDPSAFGADNESDTAPPVTDVEKRIASVWNELLSTQASNIRESFFNMGGHSLLAVRMVQRVNDEFSSRIKLREFYRDPTIYGLTELLSDKRAVTPDSLPSKLIRLRGRTSRASLFYFNGQPAGGGKYVYKMPPYLPSDRGFYIVPIPIIHAPTTVPVLASRMIELIRDAEPEGPWMLGGNCFGAALALEIAQQLTALGEHVPNLILVHPDALARTHSWYRVMRRVALASGVPESFHYAEFSSAINHTLRTVREIWRAQRRLKASERLETVRETGRWLVRFIGRRVGLVKNSSSNGGGPRLRHDRRPRLDDADFGRESVDQELVAHRHFLEEAWIAYALKPYTGKVSIIWPREGPSNPPWDPQALWKHFTPHFEWRDVPGTHVSMMHDHFEDTARALGELVEMTQ
jgi:amino acid adenylation domain-containing protein